MAIPSHESAAIEEYLATHPRVEPAPLDPVRITLSPSEYIYAAHAGFLRQASNICKGRKDRENYYRDNARRYADHIVGAVGEYVVSQVLNVAWAGPGKIRAPDVGFLQVRTRSSHDWDLILHNDDPDDAPFVLVTGDALEYRVVGWTYGRDGKRREYWSDPARNGRPAFFVPRLHLRPIADLRALLG